MQVGNPHKYDIFGQMRKGDGIGYHISEVRMSNLQVIEEYQKITRQESSSQATWKQWETEGI